MRGICDSCNRVAELFELPGREDHNCSECDADISTMILLYETLNDAERRRMDVTQLETEVTEILLKFLERCSLDYRKTPQ